MKIERHMELTRHYGSTDGTVAGIPKASDREECKRIITREQASALEPTTIFKRWNNPPNCRR